MPSNLLNADTSFPQFTEGQSDKEKIEKITSYLFMLLEQLRYSLSNLDKENFNDAGFDEIVDIITEPVYIQLADDEQRITALQVTAQGLSARISDAEGNITALTATSTSLTSRITSAEGSISTLQQTATSLTSRISDAEGNISTLQQTATSLTSRISDAEGNISTLSQTVNGMTLSVSNGSSSSTIQLMANGVQLSSQSIYFSGMVTFTDLETSGWTTINGDNITTGTIEAIDIYGCNIEGSTFRSILHNNSAIGGEIEMCYLNTNYVAGGIRLDDQGAGTEYERQYRMFVYTDTILGVPFCLKIHSANGMSIDSDEIIAILAEGKITIRGPEIRLFGDVYYNGKLLDDLLGGGV